jgi:hypothetical protein
LPNKKPRLLMESGAFMFLKSPFSPPFSKGDSEFRLGACGSFPAGLADDGANLYQAGSILHGRLEMLGCKAAEIPRTEAYFVRTPQGRGMR